MITEVDTNINCVNEAHDDQAPLVQARELVTICRPSFKKICKDKCMAELLNHLLFWIAWKCKDQAKSKIQAGMITYYVTSKDLAELLGWCEKKIRMSVNALVELGIVGQTYSQKYKMDRTKHFFFGREQYKKLIELCNKNSICLAHIGLPEEVIQLLSAFNETVHCPCTGQSVKIPNANGKNDQLHSVKMPDANGKNDHLKTKITDKDSNKEYYERTNRARQQKDNVDSSHPSTRPDKPSQNFSSEDEKQEEIVLTELGQHIFDFACKTLFKAKKPKITQKLKDECELLAPHIKNFEQFKSLLQYVQSRLEAPYHLKNMVNALNDWLQIQNTASKNMQGLEWLPVSNADPEPEATEAGIIAETTIETYLPDATENVPQTVEDVKDDDVTDDGLIDKMEGICKYYGQDSYLAACCNTLADIRDEYRLNNATLYDCMTEACRQIEWNRTPGVQAFFDELYGSLTGAFTSQEDLAIVG